VAFPVISQKNDHADWNHQDRNQKTDNK